MFQGRVPRAVLKDGRGKRAIWNTHNHELPKENVVCITAILTSDVDFVVLDPLTLD